MRDIPAAFVECESLYAVLGISQSATQSELTKAYRRKSILFHPDKNQGDPSATANFQFLSKVHQILSNERKRKLYDETGEVDEEDDSQTFEEAYNHWRDMFPKVELKDIEAFKAKYIGSEMEEEDVESSFKAGKGDMSVVMEGVPFAEESRAQDYVKIIKAKKLNVGPFKKMFDRTLKSLSSYYRNLQDESEEAKELQATLGLQTTSSDSDLRALITKKQKDRSSAAMDALMSKYGGDDKKKKKKTGNKRKELDEDEFARIQAAMLAKKKKKTK